jgi:hypothetical protein
MSSVVGGLGALARDEVAAVFGEPGGGGAQPFARLPEVAVRVVDDRRRPFEHLVTVLLREAEQPRDRLERQLRRHLDQEVAMPAPADGLEDPARTLAQLHLEPGDRARLEAVVHEQADRRVPGRVHHVEHHAGPDPARHVLERGAAAAARAAPFGGERLVVAQHRERLGVARDHPEALAARRLW